MVVYTIYDIQIQLGVMSGMASGVYLKKIFFKGILLPVMSSVVWLLSFNCLASCLLQPSIYLTYFLIPFVICVCWVGNVKSFTNPLQCDVVACDIGKNTEQCEAGC